MIRHRRNFHSRLVGAWLLLCLLLAPSPALAKWLRAESEHFIAYSYGSEKRLVEEVEDLERFDNLFRVRAGIINNPVPVKLTVYFVGSISTVQKFMGTKESYVAGYYHPGIDGPYAVVPRLIGTGGAYDLNSDQVLRHEYAHHLMLQYFPTNYPAWYVEGFAEYISTAEVEADGRYALGKPAYHRAYGLYRAEKIPAAKLLEGSRFEGNGASGEAYYGRSWLLVHFFSYKKEREGQLDKYLKLYRGGMPGKEAATEAFGDLKQLDRDLESYLGASKLSYIAGNVKLAERQPVTVTQLSELQEITIPLRLAVMQGPRKKETAEKETAELLEKLNMLAEKYPQEAEIFTLLAQAEFGAKNFTAAKAAAEKALAIDPDSQRGQLWKGWAELKLLDASGSDDEAAWKTSRRLVTAANHAKPADAWPYLANFEYYAMRGMPLTDNALEGVAEAANLIPQSEAIKMTYAAALAQKDKFDEAIAALQPIASNPHGSGFSAAAKQMIEKFRERTKIDPQAIDLDEGDGEEGEAAKGGKTAAPKPPSAAPAPSDGSKP